MSDLDRRQFMLAAAALPTLDLLMQPGTGVAAPLVAAPAAQHLPPAWTQAQVIKLWSKAPPGLEGFQRHAEDAGAPEVFVTNIDTPALHVFRPAQSNGRAILVIPGGAYKFVSVGNEGVDMANWLCPHGYTVFVLTYRLPGEGWSARSDVPLQDAQRAMRVIQHHAARFGVDPNSVGVMGFSAGGHLAASLTVGYGESLYQPHDDADQQSARPHSSALIYPVITMDSRWTHALSRQLLLGDSPTDAEVARRSPNLHVNAQTPPVFLVHAMDDTAVPLNNSLLMLEAMRAAHRPAEAHFFQEGGHGFGVGFAASSCGQWLNLYSAWLGRLNEAGSPERT